ncbi:MAG: TIGR00303 family protein [Metallosphaera sp.]
MLVNLLGNLSERISTKSPSFLLVIGTTDVSLIPGVTIAGATPELTMVTPAADAEYLITGTCKTIKGVPVTPDGIPTPAVLTRASLSFLRVDKLIVNAGARVKPMISFVDLHGEPGRDIRKGGVRKEVGERIIQNAILLAESLSSHDLLMIGESIPAGTTTAAAVLTGLGFDGVQIVSSASPNNPKDLKRTIVNEALARAPSDVRERIFWLSDPVLLAVAGLAIGFKGQVVLAGGTQMTAVAAIIRELAPERLRDVGIMTTRWIVKDSSANILKVSKELDINLSYSDIDLGRSKYNGLRVYERGIVKEGVGAGGALGLAMNSGIGEDQLLQKIERFYSYLINS